MKSDYIPSPLEETDIRSVIRLLGEVAILEIDLTQKKERLLSGLCRLIDGDGWAWSLTSPVEGGAACVKNLAGGKAEAVPALPALASSAKFLPNRAGKTKALPVLKRGAVAAEERGLRLSACQISDDKVSQLHFGRLEGRAPFSPREEMMTRIFCEEVSWLHDLPRQPESVKLKLTPRQMATLTLLTEGLSHKAIAAQLRISPNTANGYIKEIYRHFGTHSHAELLKRYPLTNRRI